jgi:hypothetical protein
MDYDFMCDLHAVADAQAAECELEMYVYDQSQPAHLECAVAHHYDTVHAAHVYCFMDQADQFPF